MRAEKVRDAVAAVINEVVPLNVGIADDETGGIDGDGQSLASTLYAVERSIAALQRARLAILRHERKIGTSWNEIAQATGVPPSTWRNRHRRGE